MAYIFCKILSENYDKHLKVCRILFLNFSFTLFELYPRGGLLDHVKFDHILSKITLLLYTAIKNGTHASMKITATKITSCSCQGYRRSSKDQEISQMVTLRSKNIYQNKDVKRNWRRGWVWAGDIIRLFACPVLKHAMNFLSWQVSWYQMLYDLLDLAS